jgi:hypothetical protein
MPHNEAITQCHLGCHVMSDGVPVRHLTCLIHFCGAENGISMVALLWWILAYSHCLSLGEAWLQPYRRVCVTDCSTRRKELSKYSEKRSFRRSSQHRSNQCRLQSLSNEVISETSKVAESPPQAVALQNDLKIEEIPVVADIVSPTTLQKEDDDKWKGILTLMTVPVVWGTYVPVVHTVYEMHVPGLIFSTAYFAVATISAWFTIFVMKLLRGQDPIPLQDQPSRTALVQGGIELGLYLFLGSSFQILGLQTVPSDRAGFLVQLTTIYVPLVEATLARYVVVAIQPLCFAVFI